MSDTIVDLACWTQDEVSQNNYSVTYTNASVSQRGQVSVRGAARRSVNGEAV